MCVALSPSDRMAVWPFGRTLLQATGTADRRPQCMVHGYGTAGQTPNTVTDRNITAGHLSPCPTRSRTTKIFQHFSCYHLYDIQINPIMLYLKLNYYSFGTSCKGAVSDCTYIALKLKMGDLDDYDFSTGDAGASNVYNMEAGQIRVGG